MDRADGTALAASAFGEQQQWRERLLTGLGWTAVAAATVGVVVLILTRDTLGVFVWASSAVVFAGVALLHGRLAFRARAWMLLAPVALNGSLVVPLLEGFVPNASLELAAAVVVAAVLLGNRSAFALLTVEALSLAVVAVLHRTGAVAVLPGYGALELRPAAAARYIAIFAVTSVVLVVAASYLLCRSEQLLLEKVKALAENERLLEERRRTEDDVRFVAEASKVLTASLDYGVTLARVARLVVPRFADWCMIDVLEGGRLRRVTGAHADPAKDALVQELLGRGPVLGSAHPVARALATRAPYIVGHATDDAILAHSPTPAHAAVVQELGTRSFMALPLIARDRPVGVITFNSARPFYYGPVPGALTEEVARRAATALDNARLYREAQDSIRARDAFLSLTSHELRTPVTSLMLMTQRLRDGRSEVVPEGMKRAVTLLDRQVTRLKSLIDDMLSVGQILLERIELHPTPTDLAALVRDEVQRSAISFENARCPVTLRADRPACGYWDADKVGYVVKQLLANAVKFGAGAPIEIEVEECANTARLTVTDHGIGIEAEALPHIFERFERAVSPTFYGGLGIGLFIVQRLVQALGGTVTAGSTPRVETRFTVELPGERCRT